MPSPSSGLRFDIYERVHLPEEVAAIDELDEIELVPRIGIVQQDEQVLLKGHLLLTGVYRAQNEPLAEQSLEHWIPVEITLPLNRIHRLDDISVEIDNFDVDLLSTRTLNITGVLSLLGIEIEQTEPAESWQREEPITVVHSRETEEAPRYTQYDYEQQRLAAEYERKAEEEAALREAAENEAIAARASAWAREQERQEALNREAQAAFYQVPIAEPTVYEPSQIAVNAAASEQQEAFIPAAAAERDPQVRPQAQAVSVPAEVQQYGDVSASEAEASRKEMRVAVASKQAEDEAEQQSAGGVGFRALLQSSRREQEARAAAEQVAEAKAAEARKSSGDEIEWKNLFYGRASDEQSFRKLRICIVQREETLDVIAGRYQLQAREIALYNRLSDQSVSEGQVLYIP
ncbi:LysM peptidoglycan-binding domain-containing protein [Paenibacillus sp. CF384]|uniref:LysM peptidoglycan-binding domain-containing protein n=1 Tax=Paenibacillus sp. CF384 TaxID=1884382 RepID=UPI00089D37FC|nr:LysM peptidoglycan-binding domain-containing protein [Paenibacillus sp. CF384]SDX40349.1 stage VI sporulation protein D [Paenibacillus sp. CF384]